MEAKVDRRLAFHYGLTIFLGAFLLFQVQPMIGKMILPWFGGSASVWTTCMLFFQLILLLGYLYSHWVIRLLPPKRQSHLHIALLLASFLLIPIAPGEAWKPSGTENPTLLILGLLFVSIGLPYFVLSTTGPLVQAWFARERSGQVPYRLFALSNLGSMLALLAYPAIVEPGLPTRWRSYAWSGLYVCFALACALLARRSRSSAATDPGPDHEAPAASWREMLLWVALAACPSILMVADTSFLTENIAPIPLLWVAPLALYLLSFILCFERRGWYRRRLFLPGLAVGLLALAYLPTLSRTALPIHLSMAINLTSFFAACMACHGELARRQPHPAHLTTYYLMLALGGCLGGFFVGVIAPYWFNSNYELSIGIALTWMAVAVSVLPGANFSRPAWRRAGVGMTLAILLALSSIRIADHWREMDGAELASRNFYGTLKVFANPEEGYRSMQHGQIVHGRQFTSPDRAGTPTTYYNPEGGAGRALQAKMAAGPVRVGVIGLGVGTLVAYGRKGDTYRLYEIDPQVIDIARSHFSFLARTPAKTEVVLGDARLQMEREAPQQFDVLVVDAFSGDSVPVHLLTREAFAQYFRHLKADGVLAVHVTNKFLDLGPVVKTAAEAFGKEARLVRCEDDDDRLVYRSRWVLVSGDRGFFEAPRLLGAEPIPPRQNFRPWQDDYSSLFSILL